MRNYPLNIRDLKILSAITFALAIWPASSQAVTQEDAQRLCTGDVMRLCSSEIPDRARIIACMHRQKASLSAGCRSVFGRPIERSASARRFNDD
jgi:hypothetical protein